MQKGGELRSTLGAESSSFAGTAEGNQRNNSGMPLQERVQLFVINLAVTPEVSSEYGSFAVRHMIIYFLKITVSMKNCNKTLYWKLWPENLLNPTNKLLRLLHLPSQIIRKLRLNPRDFPNFSY